MAKEKQFAVLGLGRFGRSVALALEEAGYDVLGVDRDENIVEELSETLTRVVSFDFRELKALEQVGISKFDTVIIASTNLETSLMATMLCKEKNVPEIIVKAIDERHAEMARKLGATAVVFAERDMARRVAAHLISSNTVDYIDVGADINILSLNVPKNFVGKNLIEANFRSDYNVNIIAITKGNDTTVTPPPDYVFESDDKIFVIGTSAALADFERSMSD